MKSTFRNMTLVLLGITFVASLGVGLVHHYTEDLIAAASQKEVDVALSEVLPPFDRTRQTELLIDNMPLALYTATKHGRVVGYAVRSMTQRGFNGVIRILVGFTPQGQIINIKVLEHSESPGFGDKLMAADNPLLTAVRDRSLDTMRIAVRQDGGDIDALTGATRSSRGYLDAVERAWKAFRVAVQGTVPEAEMPHDTVSGATSTDTSSGATSTNTTSGATISNQGGEHE